MSTATEIVEALQDQVLATVKTGQDVVLGAVRAVGEVVEGALPGGLPANPYAGALPAPAEAVDAAFGFAARLLAGQRRFVADLLAAVPVTNGIDGAHGADAAG